MSTTDETIAGHLVEVEYSLPAPQRQRINVTTTAEASSTAGLAIAPRLTRAGQFAGTWDVRHVASGLIAVPSFGLGLGHARDAASLMGELGVDWTQPREVVIEAARGRVYNTVVQVEDATEEARPARMRASWEQLAREWFIYDTTADDVIAGSFNTVDGAEKELAYLTSIGQAAGCVIRREEREPWSLRCAWADCRGPLGVDERLSHPEPAGVIEFADGDDWRQVDEQHWLCPHCSYLFTSIPQF